MKVPPVIEQPDSSPSLDRSAPYLFAALLSLMGIARFAAQDQIIFPNCILKSWLGIPCPACGSTRCLNACSKLHFFEAVQFNPLMFFICALISIWFVSWIFGKIFGINSNKLLRLPIKQKHCGYLFCLMVFFNWIYLCFNLNP
jgi:hypothetical protein